MGTVFSTPSIKVLFCRGLVEQWFTLSYYLASSSVLSLKLSPLDLSMRSVGMLSRRKVVHPP